VARSSDSGRSWPPDALELAVLPVESPPVLIERVVRFERALPVLVGEPFDDGRPAVRPEEVGRLRERSLAEATGERAGLGLERLVARCRASRLPRAGV
jgi:hypothetical protein